MSGPGSSRAVRTEAPSRRIGDAPEHGVGTVRWWWRSGGSGVDESTQREAAGDDAAPENGIRRQLAVWFRDGMPEQAEGPGRGRGRAQHRAARPDARAAPGPKWGGHPTPHFASPTRVSGATALSRAGAMFGCVFRR